VSTLDKLRDKTSLSGAAADRFVTADGVNYAYRSFGAGSKPPLLLLQRYRGTMDHWDPAFLDALASERQVLLFDNEGVGLTAGAVPNSIAAMAKSAAGFIEALQLTKVDVLGWSMGGTVAQMLTLDRPELVRRVVLAATGPGGVPDAPRPPEKVLQIMLAAENGDDDFLYLFFDDSASSRAAGNASLRRLDARLSASKSAVRPESFKAQAQAIGAWSVGNGSAFARLGEIERPVLVANGVRDVMIHASNSYAMALRLPQGKLILYPDSGHGFLFQHVEAFGGAVLEFLRA
jgi:pimeloyl-ACP methyl ester carboxylesterase